MTSNKIIPEAHPIPTHYPCIGKYELDLTRGCPVRCIYCGVKEEEKTTKLDISSIKKNTHTNNKEKPSKKKKQDSSKKKIQQTKNKLKKDKNNSEITTKLNLQKPPEKNNVNRD